MPAHEEQNRAGTDTERAQIYFIKTATLVDLKNERYICAAFFITNLLPSVLPISV
jgi:hypothetical protein